MMDAVEALTQARKATCSAIADMAGKKYQLESLRVDRSAVPHQVSDAAQAFRSAEHVVHDMVQREIDAVTKVVMERHEKKEDVEKVEEAPESSTSDA